MKVDEKMPVTQRPEPRPCAETLLQCLADCGLAGRSDAYRQLIETAKRLALMPEDGRVLRQLLETAYGFRLQSAAAEKKPARAVLELLGPLGAAATVLLQINDRATHRGGYMLAFTTAGERYEAVATPPDGDYYDRLPVERTFLRFADGIDRSPFPRRAAAGNALHRAVCRPVPETGCYICYQPNPLGNRTGDCVVRALAAVLKLSWGEAVELLAAQQKTTINEEPVFRKVLEEQGFLPCKPLTLRGHRPDGAAFCAEMAARYHSGERIFALVGRAHAAAVLPQPDGAGGDCYKFFDSWNSTRQTVGDYWVKVEK